MLVIYVLGAAPWMAARVWLEIEEVRKSPQTYSSLALGQIEKYKPFTQRFYASEPTYSFYECICMPPDLAVSV